MTTMMTQTAIKLQYMIPLFPEYMIWILIMKAAYIYMLVHYGKTFLRHEMVILAQIVLENLDIKIEHIVPLFVPVQPCTMSSNVTVIHFN